MNGETEEPRNRESGEMVMNHNNVYDKKLLLFIRFSVLPFICLTGFCKGIQVCTGNKIRYPERPCLLQAHSLRGWAGVIYPRALPGVEVCQAFSLHRQTEKPRNR